MNTLSKVVVLTALSAAITGYPLQSNAGYNSSGAYVAPSGETRRASCAKAADECAYAVSGRFLSCLLQMRVTGEAKQNCFQILDQSIYPQCKEYSDGGIFKYCNVRSQPALTTYEIFDDWIAPKSDTYYERLAVIDCGQTVVNSILANENQVEAVTAVYGAVDANGKAGILDLMITCTDGRIYSATGVDGQQMASPRNAYTYSHTSTFRCDTGQLLTSITGAGKRSLIFNGTTPSSKNEDLSGLKFECGYISRNSQAGSIPETEVKTMSNWFGVLPTLHWTKKAECGHLKTGQYGRSGAIGAIVVYYVKDYINNDLTTVVAVQPICQYPSQTLSPIGS